jgi:DNA-binding CsgD family transcriptional regulator
MNIKTREIRKKLKTCSRAEYERLIYESKLTPIQTSALKYHIVEGHTLIETADILKVSERTVSKVVNAAYSQIIKIA